MELYQEKNELHLDGIARKGDFQFKITPQAMQMFFKDIYKDPILACVRELACNAFDAHILKGNPKEPFNVHIPTELEPWFEIRDFGVGLSQDGMETLYSTFFESNKQQSNDFIGGLGIGSKSPLAYTDMFTATSFYNGKSFQYVITKNELGVPTWNFVGEFDAKGERNGLSINVPVKQSNGRADFRDVEAFKTACKKVFSRFGIRPVFTGAKIDIPNIVYKVSHGIWGVRDNQASGLNSDAGLVAVMGNIAYPINIDSLRLDDNTKQAYAGIILYAQGWRGYSPSPVDIMFPIGSLSITPSREELQYDARTIDAILAKFKEIQQEFVKETQDTITKCKSYYDALKYFSALDENMGDVVLAQKINYKGKSLVDVLELKIPTEEIEVEEEVEQLDKQGVLIKVKQKNKRKINKFQMENMAFSNITYAHSRQKACVAKFNSYRNDHNFYIRESLPVVIVKDEKCSNFIPKVLPWLRDNYWQGKIDSANFGSYRSVYFIQPSHNLTGDKKEIAKAVNDMLNNADLRGVVKVVFLSDLVEDITFRKPRNVASNAGKTFTFKTLDVAGAFVNPIKNAGDTYTDFMDGKTPTPAFVDENIDVKKSKDVYYVITYTRQWPNWNHINLCNPAMLIVLNLLGIDKVVSVPPQRMSNHIREKWINLSTFITKDKIRDVLKQHLTTVDVDIINGWDWFQDEFGNKFNTFERNLFGTSIKLIDWPELLIFKNWMKATDSLANRSRKSSEGSLLHTFGLEEDTTDLGFDKVNFFNKTKQFGDVKDFVENKLDTLLMIKEMSYYVKSSDPNKKENITMKKVIDKLLS